MAKYIREMFCSTEHMGPRGEGFAPTVGVRGGDPLVIERHDPVELANVGPGIDPTSLEIFDQYLFVCAGVHSLLAEEPEDLTAG